MNEIEEVRFWLDIMNGMRDSCYDYGEAVYRLERVKLVNMADLSTEDKLELANGYQNE